MGIVSRARNALLVLTLVATGCGDPAGSASSSAAADTTPATLTENLAKFVEIGHVDVVDRGPRCATLSIDSVRMSDNCFDFEQFPALVYIDYTNGLFLLATDPGSVISFSNGGIRLLASSGRYIAAQIDRDTTMNDLKFTVTSPSSFRACIVKIYFVVQCP
jgi:hypothetical protein